MKLILDSITSFNSLKVRFRLVWASPPCQAFSRFNSLKVRFRLAIKLDIVSDLFPFQFLKGSIQALLF
mgnify:CR=1 FL=1